MSSPSPQPPPHDAPSSQPHNPSSHLLSPITSLPTLCTALGAYPEITSHIISYWRDEIYFLERLHRVEQELSVIIDARCGLRDCLSSPEYTALVKDHSERIVAGFEQIWELVKDRPSGFTVAEGFKSAVRAFRYLFFHQPIHLCICDWKTTISGVGIEDDWHLGCAIERACIKPLTELQHLLPLSSVSDILYIIQTTPYRRRPPPPGSLNSLGPLSVKGWITCGVKRALGGHTSYSPGVSGNIWAIPWERGEKESARVGYLRKVEQSGVNVMVPIYETQLPPFSGRQHLEKVGEEGHGVWWMT